MPTWMVGVAAAARPARSGDDVEEVLVEFAVGVVDALGGFVHGPGDGAEVGAGAVAAGEDFVAVAEGSKK